MRLKSLKMQGFKSFPDKVTLTFDTGLTAVVGPNGSGKSNIGDAVRWGLGEQSSKSLRGNKMEDVIFSGTKNRRPSGFATVTLTIDNSDRILNVDDNTVEITRKLYRNGDSEYLINGNTSRLRDVSELFMDTGLGRDGYSIIGQGRAAEIVSAKSSERREIFEEASGVSKFRYKKTEAERKLLLAEENMVRLNDIVAELKGRLQPLKEQSEKATQYLKLDEHRKKLEISVWIFKINDLRYSLDGITERIRISNEQYQTLETKIEESELNIQNGYTKMQESSAKIDELQTEAIRLQRQDLEIDSNMAVYRSNIEHANQRILELEHTMENNKSIRAELSHKAEYLSKELSKSQSILRDTVSRLEAISLNVSTIDNDAKILEESINSTSTKIASLNDDVHSYNVKLASHNTMIEEARSQLDSMHSTIREVETLRDSYIKERDQIESIIAEKESSKLECKDKLSEYERYLSVNMAKYDKIKADYDSTSLEIRDVHRKIKILSDLENSMEGFSKSVRLVIQSAERGQLKGIFGTVAQLFDTRMEYSCAIETALGGLAQNIIVQNEETARKSIEYLKEIRGGRATFLPISSVHGITLDDSRVYKETGYIGLASKLVSCDERFNAIRDSLLGRIVIMDRLDHATETSKRLGYRFKIVTLDGQVINAGGSFTGGSSIHSSGVFSRKTEISTLKTQLKMISEREKTLKVECTSIQEEVADMQSKIDILRQKAFKIDSDIVRLQSELKRLDDSILQCNVRLDSTDTVTTKLLDRISMAEDEKSKCETSILKMELKLQTLRESQDSYVDQQNKLFKNRSIFINEMSQLKILQAERTKDIQMCEDSINETSVRLSDLEITYSQINDEITMQNESISHIQESIIENDLLKEKILKRRSDLKIEISDWQIVHKEYEEKVTKVKQSLRELNDSKENLSRELIRLDERKTMHQRDYDDTIAQLFDTYEMTFSEAEAFATPIEDVQSAHRELIELKSKIKSLGNVNISAIDEYKDVSERYEFMNTQLTDMHNSKNELKKLIAKLTHSMETIFEENFHKINEQFKHIFLELFGGGSAELVLTDPDDVLNSGIEIIVAPPGKVIKNLISLSGGEQAFVAIAIYFAILKVKPSPFCILDEIDAPLDEVNVVKYAAYLKRFVDTTQFIVVTHRRGTMESANILYGVTMQKDGVSKLLRMEQKN